MRARPCSSSAASCSRNRTGAKTSPRRFAASRHGPRSLSCTAVAARSTWKWPPRGSPSGAVDGLRLTDAATLDVVVGVLAGRFNTRLVAAARVAGVPAVGLTAADAGVSTVQRAGPYTAADGTLVDLGFVGQPTGTDRPELLDRLCRAGLVPIVASIGADDGGQLLNVNADTLAGHLAARLGAARFLIAGGTAGVLDEQGRTIPSIDVDMLQRLIEDGRASAGMVAQADRVSRGPSRRCGPDRHRHRQAHRQPGHERGHHDPAGCARTCSGFSLSPWERAGVRAKGTRGPAGRMREQDGDAGTGHTGSRGRAPAAGVQTRADRAHTR